MAIKESVGIKENVSIRKETVDKEGKVIKRVFFFPEFNVSVEANSAEEARKLAEKEIRESTKGGERE